MLNAEAEEGRERKKPPNPLSWKVYAQPDVTRSARHGRRRLWRADVRRVLIHFHVVVTDAGLLGASNWIRQRRTNKIQGKKKQIQRRRRRRHTTKRWVESLSHSFLPLAIIQRFCRQHKGFVMFIFSYLANVRPLQRGEREKKKLMLYRGNSLRWLL